MRANRLLAFLFFLLNVKVFVHWKENVFLLFSNITRKYEWKQGKLVTKDTVFEPRLPLKKYSN